MEYYGQMLRKSTEQVRAIRFHTTAVLRIANVNFLITPTVRTVPTCTSIYMYMYMYMP